MGGGGFHISNKYLAEIYSDREKEARDVFSSFGLSHKETPPCSISAMSFFFNERTALGKYSTKHESEALTKWAEKNVAKDRFGYTLFYNYRTLNGRGSFYKNSREGIIRDFLFLKIIYERAPELTREISRIKKNGTSLELFAACLKVIGLHTDFRFCHSKYRDLTNGIFQYRETGIIALKYKGTETESNWIPVWEGKIWGVYDNWTEVSSRYPNSDGFGKKILLIDEHDKEIYIRDRSSKCENQNLCNRCIRKELCKGD